MQANGNCGIGSLRIDFTDRIIRREATIFTIMFVCRAIRTNTHNNCTAVELRIHAHEHSLGHIKQ